MKKNLFLLILLVLLFQVGKPQNLEQFTTSMQCMHTQGNSFLSISIKNSFNESEAQANKAKIDLTLLQNRDWSGQALEWYNLSGKDSKTPNSLKGSNTLINAISFDKDQFEKCKTNQDLQRMTGYVTNNSFSHFASITDNIQQGIKYHCFLVQLENGKRALLWIEAIGAEKYTVKVKVQS